MNNSIEMLQNRIATNPLEVDSDLSEYVTFASRMKALGDSRAFDMIPAVFKKSCYRDLADLILYDYCMEMINFFQQPILEEEKVWLLIQVQDMKLFYEYSKDKSWYPKNVWFEELFAAANKIQLCEEGSAAFKSWLNIYPIPEEYRLIK